MEYIEDNSRSRKVGGQYHCEYINIAQMANLFSTFVRCYLSSSIALKVIVRFQLDKYFCTYINLSPSRSSTSS